MKTDIISRLAAVRNKKRALEEEGDSLRKQKKHQVVAHYQQIGQFSADGEVEVVAVKTPSSEHTAVSHPIRFLLFQNLRCHGHAYLLLILQHHSFVHAAAVSRYFCVKLVECFASTASLNVLNLSQVPRLFCIFSGGVFERFG